MLFQPADLDERELDVLAQLDNLKEALRIHLREPRRWFGSLRRISFARAIQGSNTIEGYSATLDDAAAVALGEQPLDASDDTRLALAGYRDVMTFVLQLAADDTFEYTEALLKSLHFMMTKHELKNRPGQWRSGSIYVRNDQTGQILYEGPSVELVPPLIDELISELNLDSQQIPVAKAAMAHLNLVMIHPFRDGNGRMARCLQSLILAREGVLDPRFVSIEEYLGRNTQEYYEVLGTVGAGAWHPERDTRSWLRFNLKAHLRQATTMLRRVKEAERLWEELEELVAAKGHHPRVIPVLFDAAMGFRVRNATYRAAAGEGEISEQTAGRDLAHLVETGLLLTRGEKRGRFYVAAPAIAEIRDRIVEARVQVDDNDPFQTARP